MKFICPKAKRCNGTMCHHNVEHVGCGDCKWHSGFCPACVPVKAKKRKGKK